MFFNIIKTIIILPIIIYIPLYLIVGKKKANSIMGPLFLLMSYIYFINVFNKYIAIFLFFIYIIIAYKASFNKKRNFKKNIKKFSSALTRYGLIIFLVLSIIGTIKEMV